MRLALLAALASQLYAAAPEVSNLLLDNITRTSARVSAETTATGPSSALVNALSAAHPYEGGPGSIALASVSGFPHKGVLQIGGERISVYNLSGNTYTIVSRRFEGTPIQSHAAGSTAQMLTNEMRVCWRLPGQAWNDQNSSAFNHNYVSQQSLFMFAPVTGLRPGTAYEWKARIRPMANPDNSVSCTVALPADTYESPVQSFTTANDANGPLPALPQAQVDTALPGSYCSTAEVTACSQLQPQINAFAAADANCNYEIRIAANLSCTGNWTLKNKTGPNSENGAGGGTGVIVIRTAADDGLLPPPGVRLTPEYVQAGLLPRLQGPGIVDYNMVISAPEDYVTGYRLVGLNVGHDPQTDPTQVTGYTQMVQILNNSNDVAKQPKRILVDRCYIGGNEKNTQGVQMAVRLRGISVGLIDSYIHNVNTYPGYDAGAVQADDGSGPMLFQNNYIEGGSITLFFGDNGGLLGPTGVTQDVTVRGNYITKPLSYHRLNPAYATQTQLAVTALTPGTVTLLRTEIPHDVGSQNSPAQITVGGASGGWGALNAAWTPTRVDKNTISVPFNSSALSAEGQGLTISYARAFQEKNAFEIKGGRRFLVEGNVMEHSWSYADGTSAAQDGTAVLFTLRGPFTYGGWPSSLSSACSYSQCNRAIEDVTFRQNIIRNSGAGINISGYDDLAVSAGSRRFLIENNLMHGIDGAIWKEGANGGARALKFSNGVEDVTARHNTFLGNFGRVIETFPPGNSGLYFDSNVLMFGSGGLIYNVPTGAGTGIGTRPTDPSCGGNLLIPPFTPLGDTAGQYYSFKRNAIIADPSLFAPANSSDFEGYHYGQNRFKGICTPPDDRDYTNNYWLNQQVGGIARMAFQDPASHNYRLSQTSPYKAGTPRSAASVSGECGPGAMNVCIQKAGAGPGHDGANVGVVSIDELEASLGFVSNIQVTAGAQQIQFNYSAPDGKACSVDVSPSNSFSTLAARVSDGGGSRQRSAVAAGLSPATSYHWRILCRGTPPKGSVTTRTLGAGSTTPILLNPPVNLSIESALVNYGGTPALGSSLTVPCSGSCSGSIPSVSNSVLFRRIHYRNGSGQTIAPGPTDPQRTIESVVAQ